MELPELIKSRRGKMTQDDFAKQLSVSRQSVNQWETGNTTPSDEQLAKMGIELHYVLQD